MSAAESRPVPLRELAPGRVFRLPGDRPSRKGGRLYFEVVEHTPSSSRVREVRNLDQIAISFDRADGSRAEFEAKTGTVERWSGGTRVVPVGDE